MRARVALGNADDASLRAFADAVKREVTLPARGLVIGAPVQVVAIVYGGHPRRGLTAICSRDGTQHEVGLADVTFAQRSEGSAFVGRYRTWLGLEAEPTGRSAEALDRAGMKDAAAGIELGRPLDLVVLACRSNALRCRIVGTADELTLRMAVRDEVPGEIITVLPTKQWKYARHSYLSGEVQASRLDVAALGLAPLGLTACGDWDPAEEYWGEEGEPIPEWALPIVARGKRPMFEFEQVLPGVDPDDFESDPILEAIALDDAVAGGEARALLMGLLAKDLRCLDAHAHLGNFEFDRRPAEALRHYAVGIAIGELTLGPDFDGVLAWGMIDNRPFMRCLHGLGNALWRLRRIEEASVVFQRMLWLNPGDNQGARFCLAAIEAGRAWEEMQEDDA